MLPLVRVVVLLLIVSAASLPAAGQTSSDRFAILLEGQAVQPMQGLQDRFGAFPTAALGVGREAGSSGYWEIRLQRYDFPRAGRINVTVDSLRLQGIQDSLDLSLEITGAGIFFNRKLVSRGRFQPFLSFGGGFYYWTDTRGAYADGAVFVDRERRSQWSGGLHGGIGSEVFLTAHLAMQAVVDYSLMFGELWPTLAVGLENVSTFQFISGRFGMRYYF